MRRNIAFLFLLIAACAPTVTKHVRVQKHIDRKPSEAFKMPVDNAKTLSKFGPRSGSYHTGVDLRGKRGGGDLVYASRAGRVMSVGFIKGYGKQIRVDHPDGYKSRYAHLKAVKVKLGQQVTTRQPIGVVGATGRASTPHLHFEILTPDGYFIDPQLLLP